MHSETGILKEQKLQPSLVGQNSLASMICYQWFSLYFSSSCFFSLSDLSDKDSGNAINYFIYCLLDIFQAKCPHSAILYSLCSISRFYWIHQLCRAFDCIWANTTMQFLQFIFCVMYPLSNLINKPSHFPSLYSFAGPC